MIGGLKGELIDALPESLRIIASCAAGYDSYDGDALAKRNIALCNSPGLADHPVADQVLYYTLSLYRYHQVFERLTQEHRNTITCRTAVMADNWDTETGKPIMFATNKNSPGYKSEADHGPKFAFGDMISGRAVRQPRGHTVGIVGFGGIGKEIGRRLSAIGMKVLYCKRTKLDPEEEAELGYPATFHGTIDSLFPESDLLVLACPLNAESHYMVNEDTLKLLPQGAKIINIGRGALIDTKALVQSLKSGHIHGAGIDVYEKEPIIDEELIGRWDVILTPHSGSATIETVESSEKNCIDNIFHILQGDEKSLTRVN